MTRVAVAVAVAVAVVVAVAVAETKAADVVKVHLNDKVPTGKNPSLVVNVHQDLKALTLDLKRDDGKKVHSRVINVPRDSKRTFNIPQKKGRHRYRGKLTVTFTSGDEGAMNLDFYAEVVAGLGLHANRNELDLENHTLVLRSRRPLVKVKYWVTSDTGKSLDRGAVAVKKPDTAVKVAWKQKKEAKVLKIKLLATDQDNINEDIELIPWTYAIPHEEVHFETGKWEVLPDESPKLDKSYVLLQKGIKKYGKLLEVKLYIAGYTDTVAAADYNQQLSEKRARSIAQYYRQKGFSHPIYYQGFGERGLKVPTPDETDEPKNRRAEYVLAAEPPPMDVPGSAGKWKRLQ
jgi:outer membrane protein OmpA-like peptidoglycan-associated protein